MIAALLVATVVVLSRWNVNYYALSPGDASPVTSFITVPSELDHPLTGNILLTDVLVKPLTALTYLQERYLSSDSQVVPAEELLGPTTPPDQLVDAGLPGDEPGPVQAKAAALTYLGYTPKQQNAGALVFGVTPGSPASARAQGVPGHHRGQRGRGDRRVLAGHRTARADRPAPRPPSRSSSPRSKCPVRS